MHIRDYEKLLSPLDQKSHNMIPNLGTNRNELIEQEEKIEGMVKIKENINIKNNKLEFFISITLSTIIIYYLSMKFFHRFNLDIIINNFKFSYIFYTTIFYSILLFIKFKIKKVIEEESDVKSILIFIYFTFSIIMLPIIINLYETRFYGDYEIGIQKYGSIYEYVDESCTPLKRYMPFIWSNRKIFWESVIGRIHIELEDIEDSYRNCTFYEKRDICSAWVNYYREWLIYCEKEAEKMKK